MCIREGFLEKVPLGWEMKDKQELNRGKGKLRAGKGVPGRGYSSCKGPEVGKKQRMQGTHREPVWLQRLKGNMHQKQLVRWAEARSYRPSRVWEGLCL